MQGQLAGLISPAPALPTKVQANIKVERDPTRVLRATAASQHRAEDPTKSGGQMIVRAPPRLAVPSWRKGL